MVMSDKLLIIVIVLLIIVIFSFDYQARVNNRNSIRIFFEDYEYPKNGIFGLSGENIYPNSTDTIAFMLVRKLNKDFI